MLIAKISKPLTNPASCALTNGTIAFSNPAFLAAINAGKIPRIPFIFPSRVNSPKIITLFNLSIGAASEAASSAAAIARSNPDPRFGSHAGESEIVTRLFGQVSPEFIRAARTRSRDSESAASGNPNSVNPGSPIPISASTSITEPFNPISEIHFAIARLMHRLFLNGQSLSLALLKLQLK